MHKKTLYTAFTLILLFGSLLTGLDDNPLGIDDSIQTTKPIDNTLTDQTFDESIAYGPDRQYNTSTSSWNTVTPEKQLISGAWVDPKASSINLNSLPDPTVQYQGESVRVDYQAKNNTVKALDYAYKEDFDFLFEWGSIGTGDGEFDYPYGIAVDSSGDVYVVDQNNDRVQKFTSTGTFILEWGVSGSGEGQFNDPFRIAVDSSGDVYVVDLNNHRIQKFNGTGTFILEWGVAGSGEGQFNNPFGIAVDSSGDVYVADRLNHRIQKFNGTGTFILEWGVEGTGDGELSYPSGLAVDSSGNVYVADTENHRIQKFNGTGTFILKWGVSGTGDGEFNIPSGIAVDSSGNIYVSDLNNDRIQKFTNTGTFILKWGVAGTGDGEFNDPFGIAVDSSGNVYVSDTANHRVQKFGFITTQIDPIGLLPISDDSNNLVVDNVRSAGTIFEKVYLGFTYYDMISPTQLGIDFSWITKKSAIFTSVFNSEQLTLDISDLAVYSSDELKIDLIFTYSNGIGFVIEIGIFDTGLNQYVFSTTTSAVSYFDFDNSIIKIDYMWAESQEITSNIRSNLKYSSPTQTLHTLDIDVYDYRIPLALYTDWNLTSIVPTASFSWDSINNRYLITNTIPTTYSITFIDGQGWGIGNPYNSTISPVIDVTNDFLSCSSFDCGNVTADMSSTTENENAVFTANTTIVSDGGVSLRMEDTDGAGSEGLNMAVDERGTYTITFDTYVELGHTWGNIRFYYRDSDTSWAYYQVDDIVTDRWQKHIVNNFTLSGDESTNNRNLLISFVSGQGVAFIDNIHIWAVKPVVTITDINKYQFSVPSTVLDGYISPTINNHPFIITLKTHEPESTLETWNEISDATGYLSFEYNNPLVEQGYVLEFNSTLYNVTISEYYFTPILGSHYINNENYDVDFDDVTVGELINLDADTESLFDGTLQVTSTGSAYWAYYSAATLSSAYSVSTRIKHIGGVDTYIGLSFFDIPNSASASDDMFFIRPGTPQTIFRVGGVPTAPMFVSATDTWYIIRADITTNYVKIYIDNVLISTRINTNPLLNPYFGVYGLDSNAQIDFVRISTLTLPQIITTATTTYFTTINNTVVSALYSDGNYLGLYNSLELITLNFTANPHNITVIPALNTQVVDYVFALDYSLNLNYLYDNSIGFAVSINSFNVLDTQISTYMAATRNGNYTAYENDTSVGSGNFVAAGTSIQTARNTTTGYIFYYAILFQNNTDQLWFNTTYSNAVLVVVDNQITVAAYSIDVAGGLFYATVYTLWGNNTVQVYDNNSPLGGTVNEGTSVWPWATSAGTHNFSIVVRNDGSIFRYINASVTIVDFSFTVSVSAFTVSQSNVSTYVTGSKDGTFTIYENNTEIATGSFNSVGTSIITAKNISYDILVNYAISFVNASDTVWFNTTYSNPPLPDLTNQLLVASYSIDADAGLFYTTIETLWANNTVQVYDNNSPLGTSVSEGTSVWSFTTSGGTHNFSTVVRNGANVFRYLNVSITIVDFSFTVSVSAFTVSASNVSTYVTGSKDGTYTVYENNTEIATGAFNSVGTSIITAKNINYDILVNYAISFVNASDTVWFNTTYSNPPLPDLTNQLLVASYSIDADAGLFYTTIETLWANNTVQVYDNDVSLGTAISEGTSVWSFTTSIGQHNFSIFVRNDGTLFRQLNTSITLASVDFSVSINTFSVSEVIISTFITSTKNGNYSVYENNTKIGDGNFISTGTSIQSNRNTVDGAFIYYAIAFQNVTDVVWFNTTYSNTLAVVEAGNQLLVASYSIDADGGLFYATIETSWGNNTVQVYDNNSPLGTSVSEGTSVWSFTTSAGTHNFSTVVRNGADIFRYLNASVTIVDFSFTVSISAFTVSSTNISTYVTGSKDGTYTVYENNTQIDTGSFNSVGTSIITAKNINYDILVNYAISFVNASDTVWFNTTYSNAPLPDLTNQLLVASYSIDADGGLFYTTIETLWGNNTVQVYDNNSPLGTSVNEGTSVWSFTTSGGTHNFSTVVRNGANIFRYLNVSVTIVDFSFTVSVSTFTVSASNVSTYVTGSKDGTYTVYENNTEIDTGAFNSTGTSIITSKNINYDILVNYAIKFVNASDTVWFTATYSNAPLPDLTNQLLVASYSIDADAGLFYTTIETLWANNTVQAYDNDNSLGIAINEGTSVWSFTTSVGQHNFSIFVRNDGTLFRQLNTSITLASVDFSVSINTFSVSEVIISTFITSTKNGNYSIYENNTKIGDGNFVFTGTSIQSNRNTVDGAFIYYAIAFQNVTDVVWFNTTYSNTLAVVEVGNQLLVASYSIDADGGLFYTTIETLWTNNTVQVYDNNSPLGTSVNEGTSVWSFTTSGGTHNFSTVVRNDATIFRYLNVSVTIVDFTFTVSVSAFTVSASNISTYITGSKDGTYTVYENNTEIDTGSFNSVGTSIITAKNINYDILVNYAIRFVNASDTVWFTTTYSNPPLADLTNQLLVASYSIDADAGLFYTTIETLWANNTVQVYDNTSPLGNTVSEGTAVWSFPTSAGTHNFSTVIRNGATIFRYLNVSVTIVDFIFTVAVSAYTVSQSNVSTYVTGTKDGTYTVYENDTQITTGSLFAVGTSIITAKNQSLGILVNYAIKFVNASDTIWFNATYSGDPIVEFSINIWAFEVSATQVTTSVSSSKGFAWAVYENNTGIDSGLGSDGYTIQTDKNLAHGVTINYAIIFANDSTSIWFNTTYSNAPEEVNQLLVASYSIDADGGLFYTTIETLWTNNTIQVYDNNAPLGTAVSEGTSVWSFATSGGTHNFSTVIRNGATIFRYLNVSITIVDFTFTVSVSAFTISNSNVSTYITGSKDGTYTVYENNTQIDTGSFNSVGTSIITAKNINYDILVNYAIKFVNGSDTVWFNATYSNAPLPDIANQLLVASYSIDADGGLFYTTIETLWTNNTVQVYDNNSPLGTAVAEGSSAWSFILSLGTHNFSVVIRNAGLLFRYLNVSFTIADSGITSGDMSVRLQNGVGQNVPFETFATYYRFNGTNEYAGMANNLLHFANVGFTVNLYVNDSFGQEMANATVSYSQFLFITVNSYEFLFTNHVNQSLLVQLKLPIQAWGDAVGYWVGEDTFRTIRLFSGTYDIRVLAADGITVLQTFTLAATSDQVITLDEGDDLFLYGYTWDSDNGNVTITLVTNYGDSRVEVWDNSNLVGTFNENGTISWEIATGVNVSQVVFFINRNITKYGGADEQQLFRGFSYAISLDDFGILISDVSWLETNDQFTITVVSNQLYSLVTIWHDGVINETGSLENVFVIDKDTITAGNHNVTLLVTWINGTGYYFSNWFVLSYWTASYYTVSIDVIPSAPGLKIKTNEIDMASFNVYIDGELVNKEVPDPFKEQTTEQINTTLIADGTLWVRNTQWNHTLTINDKWDVLVYETVVDFRDFTYRVYELPLAKITLRTETEQAIVLELYYWDQSTTNSYILGPELYLSPGLEGQTAWIVSGVYSALMYDVETRTTVILDKKVTKRITVENTGLELDTQDLLIGQGEFELAVEELAEGSYAIRLEPAAVVNFADINIPSETEFAERIVTWLGDNYFYIAGIVLLLVAGWYALKKGTEKLSNIDSEKLQTDITKRLKRDKKPKPNNKIKPRSERNKKPKPNNKIKPRSERNKKPKPEKKPPPLWAGFSNKNNNAK